MRLRIVRSNDQCLAQPVQGRGHVPEVPVYQGQIIPGLGIIRFAGQRPAVMDFGFEEFSFLIQQTGQVIVGVGRVGFEQERRLITTDGFGDIAALAEGIAEIINRVEIVGLNLQGPAITPDGVLEAAQGTQRDPEIIQVIRLRCTERNRFLDEIDGRQIIVALMVQNAEQVPSVGLVRLLVEHLPIEPFCLGPVARLMIGDGLFDG